jgi:hypothetical protein
MRRFPNCYFFPHVFSMQLATFAAGVSGPFSFVTAASSCGPELRWTWFYRTAVFTGHQLACVLLADQIFADGAFLLTDVG